MASILVRGGLRGCLERVSGKSRFLDEYRETIRFLVVKVLHMNIVLEEGLYVI